MNENEEKTFTKNEVKNIMKLSGIAVAYVGVVVVSAAYNRGKIVGAENALMNLDMLFPETDIRRKFMKYAFDKGLKL